MVKPNELVNEPKKNGWRGNESVPWGQERLQRVLRPYWDKDCVVAYNKNILGCLFMIKGKRKFFSFIVLDGDFYFGGYSYRLARLTEKEAVTLLNRDKCNILLKEEYQKIKKEILADELL